MKPLDTLVIGLYFVALSVLIWRVSRRAGGSASGFLNARHDLPWWALCLSLVATETSTLTFISIPGIGYTQGLVFLGIALGYLLGRGVVAFWFLPRYADGRLTSAYALLGGCFGPAMQRAASVAFLITRFMAESVRLLAGALPVVWLLDHSGMPIGRGSVLTALLFFTLAYTLFGGLRAVVWSDAIQLGLYGFGAAFCVLYLQSGLSHAGRLPSGWYEASHAGLLRLFHPLTVQTLWFDPFTLVASLFGGAILSLASHGTDQLMVQRVLAARSLHEARLALVGSALVVGALFGVLSLLGIQLWIRAGGQSLAAQDLAGPDALFPRFIVTSLPAGVSGLLIAGVLSATMGSLSATLNAMAGAILTDFGQRPGRWIESCLIRVGYHPGPVSAARLLTFFCGVMLLSGAELFTTGSQSAVILGLTVAGWSYGPTLGVFLLALVAPWVGARAVFFGFVLALCVMAALLVAGQFAGWHIAFSWLVPLGLVIQWGATGFCHLVPSRIFSGTGSRKRSGP